MSAAEKPRYEMVPMDTDATPRNHQKRKKSNMFLLFGFVFVLAVMAVVSLEGGISNDNSVEAPNELSNNSTCKRRIIGYHELDINDGVSNLQLSTLTHLILTPMDIQTDGTLSPRSWVERLRFKEVLSNAKRFPNLSVMFELTDAHGTFDIFRKIREDPILKENLFVSISNFLVVNHLDGLEITGYFERNEEDFETFNSFLEELHEKLRQLSISTKRKIPFTISTFLSWRTNGNVTKIDKIMEHVDFVTIEVDNYFTSMFSTTPELTGPASPLYSSKYPEKNMDYTMKQFSCLSKQPNKLNFLIDFVAHTWQSVTKSDDGPWMIAEPMNGKVNGTWLLSKSLPTCEWNISLASWSDESKTPYFWDPVTEDYVAFENARSVEEKLKYAIEKNIGGVAVWRMNREDEDCPLFSMLSSDKFCAGSNSTNVNYQC